MYYLATSAQLDPKTRTVFYSSVSGLFMGQIAHLGIEKNSTLKRGVLSAVLNGLDRIESLFGMGGEVDVLVEDQGIAEQIRYISAATIPKRLHFDDEELWARIIARKEQFALNIVSCPGEGKHLSKIWEFQNPQSGTPASRIGSNPAPHSHERKYL
jgi:hypothetical protein